MLKQNLDVFVWRVGLVCKLAVYASLKAHHILLFSNDLRVFKQFILLSFFGGNVAEFEY